MANVLYLHLALRPLLPCAAPRSVFSVHSVVILIQLLSDDFSTSLIFALINRRDKSQSPPGNRSYAAHLRDVDLVLLRDYCFQ